MSKQPKDDLTKDDLTKDERKALHSLKERQDKSSQKQTKGEQR